MHDRRVLRHRVGTGRRVQGHRHHRGRALLDQQVIARQLVAEPGRRTARQPRQRSTVRTKAVAQRPAGVGRVNVVVRPAGIPAGQRVVVQQHVRVRRHRRRVVNDLDDQRVIRMIAVLIGHHDVETVGRGITVGVARKLVSVGNGPGTDCIDGQSTMIADEGLTHSRHCDTVDRHDGRPVGCREREGGGHEFAIATGRGTGGGTVQTGLIHLVAAFSLNRQIERSRRILDGDHQIGLRGVSVAVDDGVGERIDHAARRAGIAGIAVGSVCCDSQLAIGTLDHLAGRPTVLVAGVGCDDGTVRAFGIIRQHIAGNRAVSALVDRVGIIHSDRLVIDDVDDQLITVTIAIKVGNNDIKADRSIVAGRIGGQRVHVGDRTVARQRIIGVISHNQSAGSILHDGLRQVPGRNRDTFESDRGHAIGRIEGDGGASALALVAVVVRIGICHFPGARMIAIARRQASLIDNRSFADDRNERNVGFGIGNRDGQQGTGSAAIPVNDRVIEALAHTAGRIAPTHIGVRTVRIKGKLAVLALKGCPRRGRTARVAEPGHATGQREVVSTRQVVSQDVAADRRMRTCRHQVSVIGGDGAIVHNIDPQRRRGTVAIGIGDGDGEIVCLASTAGIVLQDIVIAYAASFDAGDDQLAERASEHLPDRGDRHAIDCDRRGTIRRIEIDEAVSRLALVAGVGGIAIRQFAGARGFSGAGRQASFIDIINGVDDRNSGIVDLDIDIRFLVFNSRNDLPLFLHRARQFGVGQQITDIEGRLDIAGVGCEIAA